MSNKIEYLFSGKAFPLSSIYVGNKKLGNKAKMARKCSIVIKIKLEKSLYEEVVDN